jgi:hypothetical protein
LSKRKVAGPRPIDKTLFAAGFQCRKKLHFDYHGAAQTSVGAARERLLEVGQELLDLARKAFTKGEPVTGKDADERSRRTAELLADPKPRVLFGATFRHEDLIAEADIAISSGNKTLDLFEVKSGARVKVRHILDLAFQTLVIEACGWTVRSTNILHVNRSYAHEGARTDAYPVQKLFKSVDVTAKVRRSMDKVRQLVTSFRSALHEESVREIPTGTQCMEPFPCPYFTSCLGNSAEQPLVWLPDLTRAQERALQSEGVRSTAQLDPQQPGLTLLQRRALKSLAQGGPVVEPIAREELRRAARPLRIVAFASHLQVLPLFPRSSPWQRIPIAWAARIEHENGKLERRVFVADGKQDPRLPFLESFAASITGPGTVVVWSDAMHACLREMLNDLGEEMSPEAKSDLRAVLGLRQIDLQRVIRLGVYDPGFRGSFDFAPVRAALLGTDTPPDGLVSDDDVEQAAARLLNPRSRAPTRTKLVADLEAWVERRADDLSRVIARLTATSESEN